jgi:hypothetical protein
MMSYALVLYVRLGGAANKGRMSESARIVFYMTGRAAIACSISAWG